MIILNQRKTAIMECQSLCVAYKGGGEWDIMAESNGDLIPVGLFATEDDAASALEQMFMDLGISKTTIWHIQTKKSEKRRIEKSDRSRNSSHSLAAGICC